MAKNMVADPIISIRDLEKSFPSNQGAVHAVQKIDLDVAENEFVVLLGPSGCGKTTTLRCVAGLERPTKGVIEIAGEIVDSTLDGSFVPPERRNIGMVFQSYAVWPHLNVFQNVSLPLTDGRKKLGKTEVRDRVMECLRLVQLDGLEKRPVTDLSGGQQQRVALARAIVTKPMVLLMDEPLSNLDARLREEMRLELKKIATSIGVTTLYVTHDQAEALSLGDKICVMNDGEILQIGTPREVYSNPENLFVAEFVGEMNFVSGTVVSETKIDSPLGIRSFKVPKACKVGQRVILALRPQYLELEARKSGSRSPEGQVISKTYLGEAVLFEIRLQDIFLQVRLSEDPGFENNDVISVTLPRSHWHIFPE
tara:strand:- start:114 stop:1214 length:1101 start_codon:yes stop_codon:yes gene_type:complete